MSRKDQLALRFTDLREPEAPAPPERFSTSVTNLVALAECPQKFRWIHHDRLPRRPRRSAVLGTEFHRRAELHNLGVLALPSDEAHVYDEVPDVEVDERPTAAVVDPWDTFTVSRFHDTAPLLVEVPFDLTFDGRSVRGKADAVYAEGTHWEIVDYKSGRAPAEGIDDKVVQLEVYALAAAGGALAGETPESLSVTFAYFGSDPPVEVTQQADGPWLDAARDRVSSLLEQAEAGPFDPTPNAGCRYCDFLHHCEAGKASLAD